MCTQLKDKPLKQRLIALFHSDTHGTRFILGEMGVVLAFGFAWYTATGTAPQDNVALMGRMLPAWGWMILWAVYSFIRLYSVVNDEISQFLKYSTALLGVWLWGCMWIAGMMMKVHDATVYLYLGPMQIELWVLMQTSLWWTKYTIADMKALSDDCLDDPRWKQTEFA